MEVLITGGTGLVGSALSHSLMEKGYNVCILTRKIPKTATHKSISYAQWDISRGIIDGEAIKRADHIIHLAGAGIADKRWTKNYKKIILSSRVEGTKLLAEAISKHGGRIKSLVCASATGWYGEDKAAHVFKEGDPPANDFLGTVCRLWEESIPPFNFPVSHIRLGIVLSNNGGAYPKLTAPIRFGIAAIPGSGKQVLSWIHLDDIVRLFIMAMENGWSGVYNAVAPTPVTARYLVLECAKQIKGKFFLPIYIPEAILKLVIGGSANEVLKSSTVSAEKVSAEKFTFQYPTLHSCLAVLEKS